MVCIAVLPFENLSDNREHNYFSRGFVEDLITDLSHFPSLQVIQLDDTDHILQMIVGRILMYRRQFDLAEQHLDKSLALNANDADSLAQIATSKAFLGKARQGERLFLKALRLNPCRNIWYHPYGSFTYFVQRQYDACIQMALKGPLKDVWVYLPGYIAAAYGLTRGTKMRRHATWKYSKRPFKKRSLPAANHKPMRS